MTRRRGPGSETIGRAAWWGTQGRIDRAAAIGAVRRRRADASAELVIVGSGGERDGSAREPAARSRRKGVSKAAAKTRANEIVSGTTRRRETRKAGTPRGTRPATIFS